MSVSSNIDNDIVSSNSSDDSFALSIAREEAIETIKTWMVETSSSLLKIEPGRPMTMDLKGETIIFSGTETANLAFMTDCLLVANQLVDALRDDATISKRNLYYRLLPLFKSPDEVMRRVDKLLQAWDIPLADAGVVPGPKGLYYGEGLTSIPKTGLPIPGNNSHPQNVPLAENIRDIIIQPDVRYLILTEKNAVAHQLVTHCGDGILSFHRDRGAGIMITGKGMPDHVACSLAARIKRKNPNITVLGFFDCDTGGINILSFYTFGGTSNTGEQLGLPSLLWAGLLPSELHSDKVCGKAQELDLPGSKVITRLMETHPIPTSWRDELVAFQAGARKGGLEALGDGLQEYVARKVAIALMRTLD